MAATKMDKATKVFEEMADKYWNGEIQRKDIIEVMMKKAKLSRAAASTYFQTIKTRQVEDELN